MSPRRRPVTREQDATPFGEILIRLCDGTGALGAALVDTQGETVDWAGAIDSFDIRVAAAELRLVLQFITHSRVSAWSETRELLIRSRGKSFAVLALPEGYAVVLQLTPRCFTLSRRASSEAVRDLSSEAGLEIPRWLASREHWSRVEIRPAPGEPRRPAAVWVGSAWCIVDVLGRYDAVHLERGEIGYRARLANGAEINLVRERLGRWYAEDLPQR